MSAGAPGPDPSAPQVPGSTPPPNPEVQVGEIARAFQVTIGFGPVRMAFTTARILVFQTGEHRDFPSPGLYKQWKNALPARANWAVTNVPVPPLWGTPPIWAFDNALVAALHPHPPHGIGVDREACDLDLYSAPGGLLARPGGLAQLIGTDRWGNTQITWRVPGDAPGLTAFLRLMPIGAQVTDRPFTTIRR